MKAAFSPSVSSAVAKWVMRPGHLHAGRPPRRRRPGRPRPRGARPAAPCRCRASGGPGRGGPPRRGRRAARGHRLGGPRGDLRRRRRRRAPHSSARRGPITSSGASMPAARSDSASPTVATAERRGAALERGAGGRHGPVPVALGLHDRHQPAPRRRPARAVAALWRIAAEVDPRDGPRARSPARPAPQGRAGGPRARRRRSCRRRGRPARRRGRAAATAAAAAARGVHALGEEGGDGAGEHVAGAGGRQRRGARPRSRSASPPGRGDDRARRPSAPPRPRSARASSRAAPAGRPRPRRARGPAGARPRPAWGVMTVGAGRPAQPLGGVPQVPEPVGVEHQRQATRSRSCGSASVGASARPRPGPMRQGAARPASGQHPLDRRRGEVPVAVGQRRAHHLQQVRGDRGLDRRGHGHHGEARLRRGAWRARPGSAAPVSPGEPATTSTAPAAYLSPAGALARAPRRPPPRPASHAAGGSATAAGMPMSATTTRPGVLAARARRAGPPCRRGRSRSVRARTAAPSTRPLSASTPEGTSRPRPGRRARRSTPPRAAAAPARGAAGAGAQQRVHHEARAGRAGRVEGSDPDAEVAAIAAMAAPSGVLGGPAPGRRHLHLPPGLGQVARHHHAVAAVVPGAHDHQRRARSGNAPRVASAAARPARSISRMRGMAWSSPARRSASRMAAASKSGVQSGSGAGTRWASGGAAPASVPGASAIRERPPPSRGRG